MLLCASNAFKRFVWVIAWGLSRGGLTCCFKRFYIGNVRAANGEQFLRSSAARLALLPAICSYVRRGIAFPNCSLRTPHRRFCLYRIILISCHKRTSRKCMVLVLGGQSFGVFCCKRCKTDECSISVSIRGWHFVSAAGQPGILFPSIYLRFYWVSIIRGPNMEASGRRRYKEAYKARK